MVQCTHTQQTPHGRPPLHLRRASLSPLKSVWRIAPLVTAAWLMTTRHSDSTMRDDPEFNIKFCEVVERYPCIYDNTRSDYSNRALQNQAWTKIGEHFKERAGDCKDRWKNIRGRYVKRRNQQLPSGSEAKPTKDYYLTPHLHFLDTFLKSRKSNINLAIISPPTEDTEYDRNYKENEEIEELDDTFQVDNYDSEPGDTGPTTSSSISDQLMKKPLFSNKVGYRKRKQGTTLTDVNEKAFKYVDKKEKLMEEKRRNSQNSERVDPDMAYLQSLLPDMKAMDDGTKRKFKIGILKLADDLLNATTSDHSCPVSVNC